MHRQKRSNRNSGRGSRSRISEAVTYAGEVKQNRLIKDAPLAPGERGIFSSLDDGKGAELLSKNQFAVATHPVIKRGRVNFAEVDLVLDVAILQVSQVW